MKLQNTITDVPGIRVGHAHDREAITGCTVVLCEDGAVGGVDQRGGAPGTRETDLLRPMHLVQKVHAVVLSGGSAFGLESATGVVRYLEENGIGVNVQPKNFHTAGIFARELFDNGRHHTAGAAPDRPEINQHREIGFDYLSLKALIRHVHHTCPAFPEYTVTGEPNPASELYTQLYNY